MVSVNIALEAARRNRVGSTLETRFWAKVSKDGPIISPDLGPCWVWTGHTNHNGYGLFCLDYKQCLAHRVAWALTEGGVADDALILHSCDNPTCIRRSHLFKGTDADNMLDRDAKNRVAHGETHYAAKLTRQQVVEIASRQGPRGIGNRLAREYGVSRALISMIRSHKRRRREIT